jgi:hypothetical protein
MFTCRLRSLAVAITIACLAAAAGSAGAGTIFVEHFAGTDGTALPTYDSDYIATNNPVIAGKKAEIDSPGLTVSGKLSSGNSLYIGVPDSGSPALIYEFTNDNDLINQNPGDSSVYYASAFFKLDQFGTDTRAAIYVELPFYREGTGTVREVEFGLYRQAPLEGGGLTVAATYEFNWNAPARKDLGVYTEGSTVQVVLKAELQGNSSLNYYAAVDPSVGSEPAWTLIAQTETNAAGWNLDAVSVAAYAPNNASFGWIDEVRVGTTYDDVVVAPEPATLSLLALGGLALIRRRK